MNKVKKEYTLKIRFVNCPSREDMEYRTEKIISILVENAIRVEQEKLKNKAQK